MCAHTNEGYHKLQSGKLIQKNQGGMNQKKNLTRGGGVKDKHSFIFFFIFIPLIAKCNIIGHVFVLFWGGRDSASWDWNLRTPTKQQKWQIF